MKKSRLILGCLAVVATLALAVGCMWPDYGLSFEVGTISQQSSYSDVPYTIYNSGTKDISNLYLNIDVELSSGGSDSEWLYVGSVATGQTVYATVRFNHAPSVTVAEPRIIDMTWDQE
jgi:hypothetical protein